MPSWLVSPRHSLVPTCLPLGLLYKPLTAFTWSLGIQTQGLMLVQQLSSLLGLCVFLSDVEQERSDSHASL